MSFTLVNLVRDDLTGNLTATEKLVLMIIASRVQEHDSCPIAWPSIRGLSKYAGRAPGTIHVAIVSLVLKKYLKIIRPGKKGKTNGYEVNPYLLIENVKSSNKKGYIPVDKVWVLI